MPPRSTKAPKFTTDETMPLRISPGFRFSRNSLRCSFWVSSSQARRESTTLLRFLSSSMIFASMTLAEIRLKIAHSAQLDERRRQEAAQTDVEDQSTLHDFDHRAVDDSARLLDLLDRPPGPLVLGTLLGEDEPALFVLLLEDERLDLFADLGDLVRVDVVADRELPNGDDALGLVADVEEDLIVVDLDDRPLNDVTLVEVRRSSGRSRRRRTAIRGRPR